MSRSLGVLTLDLIAKTGGFVEGMTKAERETARAKKKMQKDMDDLKKSAVAFGKGAALAFAAAASAATAAGIAIYKSGAQSVGSLAAMSDQIGVATEDLAGLRFAAQQMSGMAEGTFDVSLRRMVRRLSEAADGAGPAVNAIKSLGLEASALARLSPEQQFHAIANAMSGIADQGTKMRATMAIFDTEGMPLINTLSQGSDAIREMQDRAEQLGLTFSRLDAAKVEAANNAIAAAQATSKAFSQQLAIQFAPVVQRAVEMISELSGDMGGMDKVSERAFNAIIEGAGFAANSVDGLFRVFTIGGDLAVSLTSRIAYNLSGLADIALWIKEWTAHLSGADTTSIQALRAQVQEFNALQKDVSEMAFNNVFEEASKELIGEKFKRFVAEATASAEVAARKTVEGISLPAANDEVAGFPKDDDIKKRLTALSQSFMTEQQMLGEKYFQQMTMLEEYRQSEAFVQEEYDRLALEAAQRYEDGLTAIKEKGEAARLAATQSALGSISTLMNGESRKLFEVGKAAAIANATISMYEGVMKAWALGPILGPILAPLVAAAGAMNIRGIAATKFGGGSAAVSNTQAINNMQTPTGEIAQRNVYVSGINEDSLVRAGTLVDLVNEELANGGRLFIGGMAA